MRIIAPAALLALAACTTDAETPPDGAETCGADRLQHLVGQPAAAHDFEAQGGPLRLLPPGSMMTMDHRPDRLNVDLDEDGLVTRLWCG